MYNAAAYFDVDGTLVGTNLVQPTWVYLSNQRSVFKSMTRVGRALLGAPAMALVERGFVRLAWLKGRR